MSTLSYPPRNRWIAVAFTLLSTIYHPGSASAEPVAARFMEGSVHGFLVMRSTDGKTLAAGDLVQVTRGGRVSSHLVFRFKDGSVDDETAVFTQHGTFHLVSDHHIQKGPAFPTPMDVSIVTAANEIVTRVRQDGQEKVERQHLDLPEDLANGIILNVLKNIQPDAKETKVAYLAATPQLRLMQLSIAPQGCERFSVAGVGHQATRFSITIELGGLAGIVAPIIGKQPAKTTVWVAEGEAPAFVKSEGALYLGGPIWSIQMISPVWLAKAN